MMFTAIAALSFFFFFFPAKPGTLLFIVMYFLINWYVSCTILRWVYLSCNVVFRQKIIIIIAIKLSAISESSHWNNSSTCVSFLCPSWLVYRCLSITIKEGKIFPNCHLCVELWGAGGGAERNTFWRTDSRFFAIWTLDGDVLTHTHKKTRDVEIKQNPPLEKKMWIYLIRTVTSDKMR